MVRRSPGITGVAVALFLLAGGLAAWGCGPGAATSQTRATAAGGQEAVGPEAGGLSADAAVAKGIGQIEAALGLPQGAVSRSSKPAPLSPSDVVLTWSGGTAEVDINSGNIRAIIAHGDTSQSAAHPSDADLEQMVSHVLELLGWDGETLAAAGFTADETKTVDRGDALTEYTETWVGHDDQGLSNGGLIEVALDTASGTLLRFFYHQGPQAAVTNSSAISKDDAIRIALDVVGDNPPADPTTINTLPGGATTTGPPLGISAQSAELVHSNAPGITGGKDMLVWIVKLRGYTHSGLAHPTVYVDAVTGKVLDEAY